jgi:tRNA-splicing ligase RtcB
MSKEVAEAIERLRRAPDVQRVAVMPDVHLAADVCIGVAVATSRLIYPQAVGGDIGCGMLAVGFDAGASALAAPRAAADVLAGLARAFPGRRRNRRDIIPQPGAVAEIALSDLALEAVRRHDGALEFATLGSGNHFIEIQADQEDDRLWLMVHSGSRAPGQAIRDHHLSLAVRRRRRAGIGHRDRFGAENSQLARAMPPRRYADASRRVIAEEAGRVLSRVTGASLHWETAIATDHNHVEREHHQGRGLWVHRKGAMPAWPGRRGVLPGSMGSLSFHVEGRGEEAALCSSAHGAGRTISRSEARTKVTERALRRQMEGIWYDSRAAAQLRDKAPAAYKDIRAVLRAAGSRQGDPHAPPGAQLQRCLRPGLCRSTRGSASVTSYRSGS